MGIGYEYSFFPGFSLMTSFITGFTPIDDFGHTGYQSFYIPQAGLKYYPSKQALRGYWLGVHYGIFLYHGESRNSDLSSKSTLLYNEFCLDTGYTFTMGKRRALFLDCSLYLSFLAGGVHWGERNSELSYHLTDSIYILLLPSLDFGLRF